MLEEQALNNTILDDFPEARTARYLRSLPTLVQRAVFEIISGTFWDFRMAEGTIETNATYTTGTVNVTQGQVTVTGVGTTFTAFRDATSDKLRMKISFGSSHQYYVIAAIGGDTSLTLAEAYNGETDTGLTYTLYADEYVMPSDFSYNGDLSLIYPTNGDRLERIHKLQADLTDMRRLRFSTPTHYEYLYYADTANATDKHCVKFYPIPSSRVYVKAYYYVSPQSLMQANSNNSVFFYVPKEFYGAILQRVKMAIYERMGDNRYVIAKNYYDRETKRMKAKYAVSPSLISRIQRYPRSLRDGGPARRINIQTSTEIV